MKYTKEKFIQICHESLSMSEAASKMKIHFNTFKRYAIKYECYNPNQSGKGISKIMPKIPISEIIHDCLHPQYQTFKLKKYLLSEKIFKNKCSICGITEWNNKPLNMELDHIDGNRTNHFISNLRMICPNCHAQTLTYRGKNKK